MVMPAWFATFLFKHLPVDELRLRVRGSDRAVDEALMAFSALALPASSGGGSGTTTWLPADPQPAPRSNSGCDDPLGVAGAAGLVGISGEAVRKALREGRMQGALIDGRWLVSREEAERYRAARIAA
jgi:hypothetical protein